MLRPRIFPTLLINGIGLIKTIKFENPRYIGDPLNAAKIFTEKGVDELAVLDRMATSQGRVISHEIITRISEECSMPVSAGGGIKNLEQIRLLLKAGAEKIIINTYAIDHPDFVKEAVDYFGSSTIVISIDVKKIHGGGYHVFTHSGQQELNKNPEEIATLMEKNGAGEILINSIDCDGMMEGYDLNLIKRVADSISIPIIACGGAGKLEDLYLAIKEGHASAATAGSMFIFQGKKRAVLINFPSKKDLQTLFYS